MSVHRRRLSACGAQADRGIVIATEPASRRGSTAFEPTPSSDAAIGHEQHKQQQPQQPVLRVPRCGPSLARLARPRCPTPLRGVPPVNITWRYANRRAVTARAQTPSSPRAGAGTRRASASLRITHVHVDRRPALRAGGNVARTSVVLRAHIPVRVPSPAITALRVDRLSSLRSVPRHALVRVLCTPTQPRARYAPTPSHVRVRGRVGLTAARFKPNPLRDRGGCGIQSNRNSGSVGVCGGCSLLSSQGSAVLGASRPSPSGGAARQP